MRVIACLICLALLVPAHSFAQDTKVAPVKAEKLGEKGEEPPVKKAPPPAEPLKIPPKPEDKPLPPICRQITRHVPDADVAYKPGVDVHGNPVVPADLEGSVDFGVLDPIEIPIEIDLLEYMDIDIDVPGLNMDSYVSQVSVYRDGRIEYNGRDIQPEIQGLCAKLTAEAADDRHDAPDVIKSGQTSPQKAILSGESIDGQYP